MRIGRLALALLALLAIPTGRPVPVVAQVPDGASFVTPFPDNDTYRLQVLGESLAEGLMGGLAEALGGDARVQVQKKPRRLGGLFRGEVEDESQAIESELGRDGINIAVVMVNPADRYPWRQPYPRSLRPGSEAWKDEFDRRRDEWKATHGPRLDRLMRAMKRRGTAVYIVGLPILRRQEATDDAQAINELLRERAYVNGLKYIDVLSVFADEDGFYSAQGPDLTGRMRQMRENDGVHFTQAGYRKLAHFIEREVKRDIALARSDRNIPLAGSEVEQRRIRPTKLDAPDPAVVKPGTSTVLPGAKSDRLVTQARPAAPQPADAAGDLRADNARIVLKSVNAQGREDSIVIDVLRPAIPANVLQLVTRRESSERASQVGESVHTEATGGAMLVSTITPSGDGPGGEARRATPTNSPYFRVLVKGERLEPKPGRADDFPWPRPEALPPPPSPDPAAPAAAATGPGGGPAAKSDPRAPGKSAGTPPPAARRSPQKQAPSQQQFQ